MRTFRIIGHGPGRLSCLGIASLSFLLAAQASAAIDLSSVQNVSGAWEISLRDTERRCTFVLRQENINSGKAIAMPAGCRRALPALADVGSWILSSQQKAITLADTDGLPVLSFAPQSEDSLIATGPEGETYELVPAAVASQRLAQATGFKPLPSATGPAAIPAASTSTSPAVTPGKPKPLNPAPPAAPVVTTPAAEPQGGAVVAFNGRSGDVAGRYIILRESSKDVGCMLTLDENARGPRGTQKAQLAPACRDQGIVVFDPIGWQLERGHLVLTARKGHQARFEWHVDGVWWKDPKEGGKPLGVKKL